MKDFLTTAKALVITLGCLLIAIPLFVGVMWLTPIVVIAAIGGCLFIIIKILLHETPDSPSDP